MKSYISKPLKEYINKTKRQKITQNNQNVETLENPNLCQEDAVAATAINISTIIAAAQDGNWNPHKHASTEPIP